MAPVMTTKKILIEDLESLDNDMEFLQENVAANDIWQNQMLWRHTKILRDLTVKELNKKEKKKCVSIRDLFLKLRRKRSVAR